MGKVVYEIVKKYGLSRDAIIYNVMRKSDSGLFRHYSIGSRDTREGAEKLMEREIKKQEAKARKKEERDRKYEAAERDRKKMYELAKCIHTKKEARDRAIRISKKGTKQSFLTKIRNFFQTKEGD